MRSGAHQGAKSWLFVDSISTDMISPDDQYMNELWR